MAPRKPGRAAFASEAELCAAFIAEACKDGRWTAYNESAGFDILLVHRDGLQVGIEAKLAFNLKVLLQALPQYIQYSHGVTGPDFRAVLIPDSAADSGVGALCSCLGITVIRQRAGDGRYVRPLFWPGLPGDRGFISSDWHQWAPVERCKVPGYVPDVPAGASAPVALTEWKIAAIKLVILLEERPVTRADFKALRLSPQRWTDPWTGWLVVDDGRYVAGPRLPDFRAQHPRNYEEIRADKAKWMPPS